MKRLAIYTDGACSPNPGVGGWAVLFVTDFGPLRIGGQVPHSTNNAMELTAFIQALESVDPHIPIDLHSDSTYVTNRIEKRLRGDRMVPEINRTLWEAAFALLPGRDLRVYHVDAHRIPPRNEHERWNGEVDALAVRFRKL